MKGRKGTVIYSFILIFLVGINLFTCGKKEPTQVSQPSPEVTKETQVKEIEEPEVIEDEADIEEVPEYKPLTIEEAVDLIQEMDSRLTRLYERFYWGSDGEVNEEEIDSCTREYFDEDILDYAKFVYGMQHGRWGMKVNKLIPMEILSQEDYACEIGVRFYYRCRRVNEQETVRVRLEWKEGKWYITQMSQWYMEFCYHYKRDVDFYPENFSKEQAEWLVGQFGGEKDGKYNQIVARVDEQGYVLAESSERLLTQEEIADLSRYEMYVGIHEIYARHGKQFSDPSLHEQFYFKLWYEPGQEVFKKENLSEIEVANICALKEAGGFGEEAEADYANVYAGIESGTGVLTGEEASVIITHAFDMASLVITDKEENYIPEKSYDVGQFYTLGEYSTRESLQAYLAPWFSETAYDYVIEIYGICGGLYMNKEGKYEYVTELTPAGVWQYIDWYQAAEIMEADENMCRVKVPYISFQVSWRELPITSTGEFLLERSGDDWVVTQISQTYIDETRAWLDEMD